MAWDYEAMKKDAVKAIRISFSVIRIYAKNFLFGAVPGYLIFQKMPPAETFRVILWFGFYTPAIGSGIIICWRIFKEKYHVKDEEDDL